MAVQAQNGSIIKFIDSPYPNIYQPIKQANHPKNIGKLSFFAEQIQPIRENSQLIATQASNIMIQLSFLLIDNLRKLRRSFHMLVIATAEFFPSKRNQIKVCGNVAWQSIFACEMPSYTHGIARHGRPQPFFIFIFIAANYQYRTFTKASYLFKVGKSLGMVWYSFFFTILF